VCHTLSAIESTLVLVVLPHHCHDTVSLRYVAFEDLRRQNPQNPKLLTTFGHPATAPKGYISVAQAAQLTSPLEDQRSDSTYAKLTSAAPVTLREPEVADGGCYDSIWPSRPTSMAEVSWSNCKRMSVMHAK